MPPTLLGSCITSSTHSCTCLFLLMFESLWRGAHVKSSQITDETRTGRGADVPFEQNAHVFYSVSCRWAGICPALLSLGPNNSKRDLTARCSPRMAVTVASCNSAQALKLQLGHFLQSKDSNGLFFSKESLWGSCRCKRISLRCIGLLHPGPQEC